MQAADAQAPQRLQYLEAVRRELRGLRVAHAGDRQVAERDRIDAFLGELGGRLGHHRVVPVEGGALHRHELQRQTESVCLRLEELHGKAVHGRLAAGGMNGGQQPIDDDVIAAISRVSASAESFPPLQ